MVMFLSHFKDKRYWGVWVVVCYIIFSLLTLGPVIVISGEDYFCVKKSVIDRNCYISPFFVGDYFDLEIPFIIIFCWSKNNNKKLRINFLPSFTVDSAIHKLKTNNHYLDELNGIEIDLVEYCFVDGVVLNLLKHSNVKKHKEYIEIDFGKKSASGDLLRIMGKCKLKDGTKINFNYEYEIEIKPPQTSISLRIFEKMP